MLEKNRTAEPHCFFFQFTCTSLIVKKDYNFVFSMPSKLELAFIYHGIEMSEYIHVMENGCFCSK